MDLTKGEFGGTIGEGIPPSAAKLKIEKTEHPSTVTPIDQSKVVQETFPIGQQAKPEQPVAQSQAPALEPKQSAPVPEQTQVENLASAAKQAPAQKLFASANDTAAKIEQSRPQSNLIASKPESAPIEPIVKSAAVGNTPEVKQVSTGPIDQNQSQSVTRQSYTPASFDTPKSPAADTSRSDYSKSESPVSSPRYADTGSGASVNRNISDQKDPTSRVLDTTVSKTNTSSEGAAYSSLQQGQTRTEVREASASMNTSAKFAQREPIQSVSEGGKTSVTEPNRQDGSRTETKNATQVIERSDNKIETAKTDTFRNAEVRVAESADVQTAKPLDVQTSKLAVGERNDPSQARSPEASGSSGQKSFTENTPNQNRPDARSGVTDSGSRGVGGGGSSSFDNPGVRSPEPQSTGSASIKDNHSGSSDSSAGSSAGKIADDPLGQKPNKIDANQHAPSDSGTRGVGGGSSSTAGNRLTDLPDKTANSDSSTAPSSKQGEQSAAVSADNVDRRPDRPPKLDGELIGPILDGDKKAAKPTDVVQPSKRDPVEISNQISRELDRLLTNKAMQPKILAVIEHLLDKKPLPPDVPKDLLDVVKHTDQDRLKTLSVVIRGALAQQELLQTNPKATPLVDVALIADSSVVRARKGIDNADADEILEKKADRTQASSDEDFTEAIAALKKMRQLFRELQQEIPVAQRSKDVITDELESDSEERSSNDGAAHMPQASASATYVPPHDESLEEIAVRLLGDRNLAPLLLKINPRLAVGAGNVVPSGSSVILPSAAQIELYKNC